MFRIDGQFAVLEMPVPSGPGPKPNGFYSEGNPQAGIPATVVTADQMNTFQEELVNVVVAAGLDLDKTDNTQLLQAIQHFTGGISGIPPGLMTPFAGISAPSGWLLCAGQEISRTTYSTLFTAIGTAYGAGDGATTFRLPDMRGRFPLGLDNMGGNSANRVTNAQADLRGGTGGAESVSLTADQNGPHTHIVPSTTGYTSSGSQITRSGWPVDTLNVPTNSSGAGQAHENMSPYMAFNYIIKI